MKRSYFDQTPRRLTHARVKARAGRVEEKNNAKFDYSRDYKTLDLRKHPELYRVGVGEQGVLLVEPYKSEILPFWKFATPEVAKKSARKITQLFNDYRRREDFVGMDMARKFLQMGYTRSRRYANHQSGRKYSKDGSRVLDFQNDPVKAQSAEVFFVAWKRAEEDPLYADWKVSWRQAYG